MADGFQVGLIAFSFAVAIFAAVHIAARRTPGWGLLGALGLLEAALLAQCVAGLVQLAGIDRPLETATFLGYLIGVLFVLPVATGWAVREPSRYSTAVIMVGVLTVIVLIARLQQVWDGAGAG